MVKATINFDDELYRRLIKETVERYGKMRGFSKLVNEKLKSVEGIETKTTASKPEDEEIKRRLEIVRRSAGSWNIKETGAEYVRRTRRENEKRLKRMGL